MSAKFEKKLRRIARGIYNYRLRLWEREKPPRLCIFKYSRWKKRKPRYQDVEKEIRKIYK